MCFTTKQQDCWVILKFGFFRRCLLCFEVWPCLKDGRRCKTLVEIRKCCQNVVNRHFVYKIFLRLPSVEGRLLLGQFWLFDTNARCHGVRCFLVSLKVAFLSVQLSGILLDPSLPKVVAFKTFQCFRQVTLRSGIKTVSRTPSRSFMFRNNPLRMSAWLWNFLIARHRLFQKRLEFLRKAVLVLAKAGFESRQT